MFKDSAWGFTPSQLGLALSALFIGYWAAGFAYFPVIRRAQPAAQEWQRANSRESSVVSPVHRNALANWSFWLSIHCHWATNTLGGSSTFRRHDWMPRIWPSTLRQSTTWLLRMVGNILHLRLVATVLCAIYWRGSARSILVPCTTS